MKKEIKRRDFNHLAMAALGGVVAGSVVGCGGSGSGEGAGGDAGAGDGAAPESSGDGDGESAAAEGDGETSEVAVNDWTSDTHVCRGLNACKGKGAGGDNECAGLGNCATAKAHACHTMNDCKFQGGCGETVGVNSCKGKGECAVPLMDKAWTTARERFEAAMTKAGKEFGDAPAKKPS